MRSRSTLSALLWMVLAVMTAGLLASCVALPPPGDWIRSQERIDASEPVRVEPSDVASRRVARATASPLTWQECLRHLRGSSPTVAAVRARVEAAGALLDAASAAAYPRVDVRGAWIRFLDAATFRGRTSSDVSGTSTRTRSFTGSGSDIYSAGVDVSYPVFDGGTAYHGMQAAAAALEAVRGDATTTVEDLELAVIELFMATLLTDGAVRIGRESLEFAKRESEQARVRAELGDGLAVDALRFDTRASEEQLALNRAAATRQVQIATLSEILGVDLVVTTELEPPTVELDVPPEGPSGLVARALDQRGDFAAVRARRQEAASRLRVAESSWWPTLNVFGSYGFVTLDTIQLSDENDEFQVGAAAQMNLFEGGATRARAAAARAELLETVELERQLRLRIEREVEAARIELDVARQNVAVSREMVELAKQVLDTVTVQYREGEARVIDAMEAELQRARAELAFLRSRVELFLTQARLRRAVGIGFGVE